MARCEGTKIWRDKILGMGFVNINAETGIGRMVGWKHKVRRQKWECT
jgi:hypothetical protein